VPDEREYRPSPSRAARVEGALIGGAVGDSVGLPWESLSSKWTRLLDVEPTLGAISDDTEHAAMTLLALQRTQGNLPGFREDLAQRLKIWLLSFPFGAGIGTVKALLRLWAGVPSERSGSMSAGNGPAMRAAVIGAWAPDVLTAARLARESAKITHSDPRASDGAAMIAVAAHIGPRDDLLEVLAVHIDTDEMHRTMELLVDPPDTVNALLAKLDSEGGTSGFIVPTVAVALYGFIKYKDDAVACVKEVVRAGGDTDTVAAIAAGMIGATYGEGVFPEEWIEDVRGWPWTTRMLRQVAAAAVDRAEPIQPRWFILFPRNVLWFIVFVHWALMRRLLLWARRFQTTG
jgi:ADP-ribosyl-[dinitrogen reductase] hydrolase